MTPLCVGILLLTILIIAGVAFVMLSGDGTDATQSSGAGTEQNGNGGGTGTDAQGTVISKQYGNMKPQRIQMFGRTHMYQIPDNPVGTLVFFHGCGRSVQGFWPYHPEHASDCYGLPEDVSHTKQALRRGYAFIALTPSSKGCWSMAAQDGPQTTELLEKLLRSNNLIDKPMYVAGASSGAGFSIRLQAYFEKVNTQLRISGVMSEVNTNISPLDGRGRLNASNFPPVVWILLEGDVASQREAKEYVATVMKNKVPAAYFVAPIRVITPDYFAERIPSFSKTQSQELTAALKKVGLIDAQGKFKMDPSQGGWRSDLKRYVPTNERQYTLNFVKSAILQSLLVAYAYHEHVADYTTAALMWFENGGKSQFSDLAEKYKVTNPNAI